MGNFVERLFPTDPLPSGIGIAFRPRPFKRVILPIGMVYELGRRLAFETKHSTVRMIMVSFEPNDLPIENRCDCRAMRRAQSAKTAQRFRALSGIQHCVQNNLTLWRLSMVARNPSGSGVLRNLPRI